MSTSRSNLTGAALSLAAFGVYATHDVVVKFLGSSYNAVQIIFFSGLLSFPLVTAMLLSDKRDENLVPRHPWWSLIRAVSAVLTGVAGFFAFSRLPMAQAYFATRGKAPFDNVGNTGFSLNALTGGQFEANPVLAKLFGDAEVALTNQRNAAAGAHLREGEKHSWSLLKATAAVRASPGHARLRARVALHLRRRRLRALNTPRSPPSTLWWLTCCSGGTAPAPLRSRAWCITALTVSHATTVAPLAALLRQQRRRTPST